MLWLLIIKELILNQENKREININIKNELSHVIVKTRVRDTPRYLECQNCVNRD